MPLHEWRTDRGWRWCQCLHAGVRWRDGDRGLLEVTAVHGPDFVRVLGLNNHFLQSAMLQPDADDSMWWRLLHDRCATEVHPSYLFHESRRACWAVVVRVGDSGDVVFVPDVVPPSDGRGDR